MKDFAIFVLKAFKQKTNASSKINRQLKLVSIFCLKLQFAIYNLDNENYNRCSRETTYTTRQASSLHLHLLREKIQTTKTIKKETTTKLTKQTNKQQNKQKAPENKTNKNTYPLRFSTAIHKEKSKNQKYTVS